MIDLYQFVPDTGAVTSSSTRNLIATAELKAPTLTDVAQAAGVSYATADRVINNRGNVALKSTHKVQEAMAALGYVRNLAAANLSRQRTYQLAFLLPGGKNAFFNRMRNHLEEVARRLAPDQITIDIIAIDAFAIKGLKQSLTTLESSHYDAIGVVGLQAKEIVKPLKSLSNRGTIILGLVSDLPVEHRAAYIGIDNEAAGRTAARLMGLAHGGNKGCIQLFAGSLNAGDHAERLKGFTEVIESDYPLITCTDALLTKDQANAVEQGVEKALRKRSVTALYNVGAGNAGLVSALRSRKQNSRPLCVVHELVPHTLSALHSKHIDVVIDQRPDIEINRAVSLMRDLIDKREPLPTQPLVPSLFLHDNAPLDVQGITPGKNRLQ